jgi:type IV fimbrial biogenesis protein FimT
MIMRRHSGFTMVELMVVLAVVALLATLVAPSFNEQLARRRLEGVATDLSTDLQFARTQAVSNRATVVLVTTASGYTVYPPTAILDSRFVAPKTSWGPPPYGAADPNTPYKDVTLSSGITLTAGTTVTYDPLRATANPVQITLSNTRTAAQLRVDTNAMGRVSICTIGGSFKGYTTCT